MWDREQYTYALFTVDKVNHCGLEKKKKKKEENVEKKRRCGFHCKPNGHKLETLLLLLLLLFKNQIRNFGKNGHIPLFGKIFMNLPMFAKYLTIYHFFETQFCKNRVFHIRVSWTWVLWKKFHSTWVPSKYFKIFSWYLSSFMELKCHEKLNFLEIEFQKSNKLLNISQIVTDCIIFLEKVVFGNFARNFSLK